MPEPQQAKLIEIEKMQNPPHEERHPIEASFNTSAKDILDAIEMGFRTKVDVKGKLAELYVARKLEALKIANAISDYEHQDIDGEPDFLVTLNSKIYRLEVKNLRNGSEGIYWKRGIAQAYKVEVQKTRNSRDGSNTRHYKKDYIDILAVCLFNQSGQWEYYFIKAVDLEIQTDHPEFLKVMQRVPLSASGPWKTSLLEVL